MTGKSTDVYLKMVFNIEYMFENQLIFTEGYECCPEGHHVCSQSEYARCYDARNSTWIEIEGVESDREESESEDGGEICCLRKNVMSAGIVMSGYKVVLNIL